MSNKLFLLACFILFFGLAAQTYAQDPNVIPKTGLTPVIDGQLDTVWESVTPQKLTKYKTGVVSDSDCSASWRALWDDQFIYVFVDVNDDNLSSDNTGAANQEYQDDSVEIYFDIHNDDATTYVNPSDDYQYRFSWEPENPTVASDKAWNETTGFIFAFFQPIKKLLYQIINSLFPSKHR